MALSNPSHSSHPVIAVLEAQGEKLHGLTEQLGVMGFGHDGERDFIRENFGFLADDVVDAGEFTLEAPDLLDVWTKVLDVLENRHLRYRFAAIVAGGFAVQPLADPRWRAFPRHYHEARVLQEELREDQAGLDVVRSRLGGVFVQLDEARRQTGGTGVGYEVYENFGNGAGVMATRLARYARGEN